MFKAIIDTNVLVRLFVQDDRAKAAAGKKLLEQAHDKGNVFDVPGIVLLELVWVLEKHYKLERPKVREYAEAVLNTPVFRCEMEDVFRNALDDYVERRVKFADAVIAAWGMGRGINTVFTFDERDFKKIKGIEVRKP